MTGVDLRALQPGGFAVATVLAAVKWNHTGVLLEEGAAYRLDVTECEDWRDAHIPATPAGYERWHLTPFSWLRRAPAAGWFALIGTIGEDEQTAFVIGPGLDLTAPQSGELCCFANDVSWMYGNNHGALTLRITRPAE